MTHTPNVGRRGTLTLRNLRSVVIGCFLPFVVVAQSHYPPVLKVRSDFRQLLERPKTALDPKSTILEDGPFFIERGSFASEPGERVPFVLIRAKKSEGKSPVVIALHGTGGDKEGQLPLLRELAQRGFVGVAIDGRHHGERVSGGAAKSQNYQEAIIRAWREKDPARQEHPFFYDTAWDLWRTVDFLEKRPEVDRNRIGVIGFSKGGIESWLGASIDERIKVVIPAIAVQSFRWSLENDRWQGRARTISRAHEAAREDLGEKEVNQNVCRQLWAKVIPGILDKFDCPSMIRLLAPRPLLILSGENDPNCPLPGAQIAFSAAEAAYKEAGAPDRLKINIAAGVGHKVTEEQRLMAISWFERWLKN